MRDVDGATRRSGVCRDRASPPPTHPEQRIPMTTQPQDVELDELDRDPSDTEAAEAPSETSD